MVQPKAEPQARAQERGLIISLVSFLAPAPTPALCASGSVSSKRAQQPFRKSIPRVSVQFSYLQVNAHTISEPTSTQATNHGNKCLPTVLGQM